MGDIVETDTLYLFLKGWPSQWYPSKFTVDGQEYTCAEQYMMAEKARFFDDRKTCGKILATNSPREQKRLGRQVTPYDEGKWAEERQEVVYRGNLAKFKQNEHLRKLLISTGTKTLVEANPDDRIWGIGLSADDPKALNPQEWRGKNLLGKALMRVRDELTQKSA